MARYKFYIVLYCIVFAIATFSSYYYLFIYLYQSTVLSSCAVYSASSVIGKASSNRIKISPTPPLIFRTATNVQNLSSFNHHSILSRQRLKMHKISELWNISSMLLFKFAENKWVVWFFYVLYKFVCLLTVSHITKFAYRLNDYLFMIYNVRVLSHLIINLHCTLVTQLRQSFVQ